MAAERIIERLYSFDLSEYEAGEFVATRYPIECAVSGGWLCVASSDAEALERAHHAAWHEWAAPATRMPLDFKVRFVDSQALRDYPVGHGC